MRRMKLNFYEFHKAQFFIIAAIAILLTGCLASSSMAQEEG